MESLSFSKFRLGLPLVGVNIFKFKFASRNARPMCPTINDLLLPSPGAAGFEYFSFHHRLSIIHHRSFGSRIMLPIPPPSWGCRETYLRGTTEDLCIHIHTRLSEWSFLPPTHDSRILSRSSCLLVRHRDWSGCLLQPNLIGRYSRHRGRGSRLRSEVSRDTYLHPTKNHSSVAA